MASIADVTAQLDESFAAVRETLLSWSRLEAGEGDQRSLLLNHLTEAGIGESAMLGSSSVGIRGRGATGEPGVLVVGSHDSSTLAPALPATSADLGQLRGPGTGSLIGPTLAFVEGIRASRRAGDTTPRVDLVSIGPGDSITSVLREFAPGPTQVIAATHAVQWNSDIPTVTTGSRGLVEVELTLSAPVALHDDAYAGAAVNPLNEMVRLLGTLRDARGKISLDGFYNRAMAAPRGELNQLEPADWQRRIGAAMPTGSLSGIERATVWPTISLLDLSTPDGSSAIAPSQVTARVAVHLVPNQRPVDVEQALRSWFSDRRSMALDGTFRVVRTARPYRSSPDDAAVVAHMRATKRLHRRVPATVPGGGGPGAGDLHYATNAPVCFFGLCGPTARWGSADETLTVSQFETGVAVAAFFLEDLAQP